jgi:hypothetical protein
MTAPFAATTRSADSATRASIPAFQAETLRQTLLAGRAEQSAEFTQHAVMLASLTADSSEDADGLIRALAALRMYRAREAIEQIDHALVRLRVSNAIGGNGRERDAFDPTGEWPSSLVQRRSS